MLADCGVEVSLSVYMEKLICAEQESNELISNVNERQQQSE
jgi:hypothetical protein